MPYAIDFAELKQRVSIEQAADMLGLKLIKSGPQRRGTCPICKAGGDRAFVGRLPLAAADRCRSSSLRGAPDPAPFPFPRAMSGSLEARRAKPALNLAAIGQLETEEDR